MQAKSNRIIVVNTFQPLLLANDQHLVKLDKILRDDPLECMSVYFLHGTYHLGMH